MESHIQDQGPELQGHRKIIGLDLAEIRDQEVLEQRKQ